MVKFQLAGKYCELHTDPEIIKNISKSYQKGCGSFCFFKRRNQELVVAGKTVTTQKLGLSF